MDKLVVCEKCGEYVSPWMPCKCKKEEGIFTMTLNIVDWLNSGEDLTTFINSLRHNKIRHNEVRIVNMPVKFLFQASDKIIDEVDLETGNVRYKSGFYMIPIMEDDYVYDGQPTEFYCSVYEPV
jgi:hypothetical protein